MTKEELEKLLSKKIERQTCKLERSLKDQNLQSYITKIEQKVFK